MSGSRTKRSFSVSVAVMALAVMLLAGCAKPVADGVVPETTEPVTLTLAAYSIPEAAYKKIIPAFQSYWKDKTGEDVTFTESYGGSGSQARAVIDGLEADVVNLAMEPDVTKIEEAGLIQAGWQDRTENRGIVTTSLIVFGVREGNPKSIAGWEDVSATGIGVITPNPKTSGGAQWNLLSSWGSVTQNGGTEDEAYRRVKALYANAIVLDKNARDASNTFLQKGIGDVALLWESDALIAKSAGGEFDIVIPQDTIEAQTAVTVVDSVVDKRGTREVAEAFVDFLFTAEAQKAFAETGLRPVDPGVLEQFREQYPDAAGKQFGIDDFGGWPQAGPKFFGDGRVYSKIEAEVAKER